MTERVRIFESALRNVKPAHPNGFLTLTEYRKLSSAERDALHEKVRG